MSLKQKTRYTMTLMVMSFMAMVAMVASASPMPSAVDIAGASSTQLLAWAVVLEAGVIVAMAGVIIQAYRNRVAALERQVDACRQCADKIAAAMSCRHPGAGA